MKYTYNAGRDAVSLDINGLDQSGLVETNGTGGSSQSLGTSVESKGRGGGGEDGEKGKGGDLHGVSFCALKTIENDYKYPIEKSYAIANSNCSDWCGSDRESDQYRLDAVNEKISRVTNRKWIYDRYLFS